MADKRAFKTLVASMDRKAKELSDYLQQSDANIRIAKSKSEKLRKDIATLDEVVSRCVGPSETNADETYAKQQEVLNLVETALEGADEFVEIETFKNDVQIKSLEVESVHQSVCSRLSQLNDRIMNEKAGEKINLQAEKVFSDELDDLEAMAKNGIEKINFLILNDVENKVKYQDFQSKFDSVRGEIVGARLSLIKESESDCKPYDHVVSTGGNEIPAVNKNSDPINSGLGTVADLVTH